MQVKTNVKGQVVGNNSHPEQQLNGRGNPVQYLND